MQPLRFKLNYTVMFNYPKLSIDKLYILLYNIPHTKEEDNLIGNVVSINNSKNPIINKIRINRETYFGLDKNTRYDYSLIKEIFTEFEYDLPFLEKVLGNISENLNEYWILEFNIRYLRLVERQKQYDTNGYLAYEPALRVEDKVRICKILIDFKSHTFMNSLEELISSENAEDVGMGFDVIQNMFEYSEIIKNYYAEEFIRKIFQNPNIEHYLHENFRSFDDVEKNGITTFIINYVAKRDQFLSSYISNHLEILGEINYALECIRDNWNRYIELEENKIISTISSEVWKYIEENAGKDEEKENNIERLWKAACYAAYKFDILEKFYTNAVAYDPEYLKSLEDDFKKLNLENESIDFKRDYVSIKNIMDLYLNKRVDLSSKLGNNKDKNYFMKR